jgi:tetratricopeptide (TPR) repeat protein
MISRCRGWWTWIKEPSILRVLNNLGMSYADRRDVPTAIEFYEKAVSVDSQNPVALHNLGNAYQTLGDAPRAISYYKEAIDHDPAFGYSYSNLINILIQQGNSKEARAYLEKYLSVSARPLDVLELLAQLAIAEKEYGRALEYVNRALQVDPQNNQFGSAKIELERLIKTQ